MANALDRFVEQAVETHRVARTRLEGPAIVSQHRAKANVLQRHVRLAPEPGRGEELREMQTLAVIDHIQNRVGRPLAHAIFDRGQVGRGIEKRPVLLANHERCFLARQKHTERAVALAGNAAGHKVAHHHFESVVIKTLAERVVESHSQPTIHAADLAQAGRQERSPQVEILGVAGMQLRGFDQHLLADVGMCPGQCGELGVLVDRRHAFLERTQRVAGVLQLAFGAALPLDRLLGVLGRGRRGW